MDTALLQSATVAEAMQTFDTVPADMPLSQAAALMRSHHGRALIVETGLESPAIFTEFDIIKVVGAGDSLEGKTVGEYYSSVAIAATPDWTLDHAVDTMRRGNFRHLVVVDDGQTVGLLTMRDVFDVIMDPPEREEPAAGETVEFGPHLDEEAAHLLHNLRRSAKQHLVAAKCDCELDWIEVVIEQADERPDLTRDELQAIWDSKRKCPTLHAMGGGGD